MSSGDIIPVDPARLASGEWSRRLNKTVGEGDINASYSGDRIGMGEHIRKPFDWRSGLWVCVGNRYLRGMVESEAYRLLHPSAFDGEPTTYAEKSLCGDEARSDPRGFYHGMTVRHGGQTFVLCGPPLTFIPGEPEQPCLF